MATPLTPAQRKKILALHAEGKGRNDIARAAHVSMASVSKVVADAGLSFDRTATRAATDAKKADSRARRAQLAAGLLDDVEKLRARMFVPTVVYAFGGKDNSFEQAQVDEPPHADKLKLMQAASVAMQRHMDLERHDADEKAESAKSMLLELGRALGVQTPDTAA